MMKTLNPKPYTLSSSAGFTLVEALVSLLVFSIALSAIFYLLTNNLREASLIRDNFIASGLVQEGVEVTRNIRDSDWYLANPFGTSIPEGTYRIQWNSQALLPSADLFLKKDGSTGMMGYDTGSDTLFKRAITISTISAIEKMAVVTVTWNERGRPKSISAEEHLFNWK